ncbi:MAG: peptidoglycan editing factor PgeF [Gammaproteobacteria bacterium]|nr:peptidoglycan editing factor PgeF [Gammaproteobacteria bacterium]
MPDVSVLPLLIPDWPAPPGVRAVVTTRLGGVSHAPWASLNLAQHVGDDPQAVTQNRHRLCAALGVAETAPVWLEQVHGIDVRRLPDSTGEVRADASVTDQVGPVCVVMTADCLPVLFCDRAGTQVAAAHAGWRGLVNGVLEATLARFAQPEHVMAWMGPAIGPGAFEVGEEVRQAFVDDMVQAGQAFVATSVPGKYLADLYLLARLRLQRAGVSAIYGGGECTFTDAARFYSFRREPVTGRMASLIWLEARSG